ncbi:MAG: serine O-acetyltransferase, partial [Variovorax paradoxus]
SNAVVIKPVPAGATAVGIPARIILPKGDAAHAGDAAMAAPRFSAYGITPDDDPLSQAMRGLIDHAANQEQQIALLWQALEALSERVRVPRDDCVPDEAARETGFETERFTQLVGK